VTTAEIENVGTGRMPLEVAAVRGERFPSDSTTKGKNGKKPELYQMGMQVVTLGGKEKQSVTIRTDFKPEKVVVDPNVRVLQLRRQSAEAKL
jgi:ABC-2 type transport system permease protein